MNGLFWDQPVLAIESSCDETSAAVVLGREILSNVVSSQVDLHAKWGGIVPEAAARAHIEAIAPVVQEAVSDAGMSLAQIQGIAVTNRPGLIGALSVGISFAKGLAFALKKPLVGVHHLEGHLVSPFSLPNGPRFPHLCLIVSGGHTEIVSVDAPMVYRILGQTLDDAAGEAFDKGARLLGLGYPGGRAIQEQARKGNPKAFPLPKGLGSNTLDFSFSGLKTAVLRLVEREGPGIDVPDAAASLQHAIVSVLAERTVKAAEQIGAEDLAVAGGVAANEALRNLLAQKCSQAGIRLFVPNPELCTDNAAMIGLAGSMRLAAGQRDSWALDAVPNAELPEPPTAWDAR